MLFITWTWKLDGKWSLSVLWRSWMNQKFSQKRNWNNLFYSFRLKAINRIIDKSISDKFIAISHFDVYTNWIIPFKMIVNHPQFEGIVNGLINNGGSTLFVCADRFDQLYKHRCLNQNQDRCRTIFYKTNKQ